MAVYFSSLPATFIHVPKTGGTSFYDWIAEHIPHYEQQPNNNYEEGSVEGATKQWSDLGTVFSFVRNPYSRLVSLFHYQYRTAQEYVKSPDVVTSDSYMDHLRLIAISKKGFDHWVECICTNDPKIYSIYDGHPDRITVSSWFNNRMPDLIIKTEHLNEEFYKVRNLILPGNNDPLPWNNTTEHKPYREYYNPFTKALVAKKFEADLNNFNYDF